MVWKVYVSVFGENCDEHGWHSNALTFPTKDAADEYGRGLFSRWTMVKEWESREVSEEDA